MWANHRQEELSTLLVDKCLCLQFWHCPFRGDVKHLGVVYSTTRGLFPIQTRRSETQCGYFNLQHWLIYGKYSHGKDKAESKQCFIPEWDGPLINALSSNKSPDEHS